MSSCYFDTRWTIYFSGYLYIPSQINPFTMSNKRSVKNKHLAPSQDFFTLGATSSAPPTSSQILPQGLAKLPAKRNEASFSAPNVLAAKRPKLNSPMQQIPSPSMSPAPVMHSVIRSPSVPVGLRSGWEDRAIMVPPKDLKDKIFEFEKDDKEDKIEQLLCGAAKQLREQKTKPDACLVFTLIYLAKVRPLFFCSNTIVEAFSSLLKRESLNNFIKIKNNSVPILVVNLFHYAFHDENSWPEIFIKMYIDDSLGDRVWVDNDECKDFVDIIIASFKTKLPPKSSLQTSDVISSVKLPDSLSLSSLGDDSMGDETSCSSNPSIYSEGRDSSIPSVAVTSRYIDNEEFVVKYVTEVITEYLNRRQNLGDISRNMLKLLISTAGIRNIRLLVIQKLEQWFQNPKLSRPAQDLLLTICLNCNENDADTLSHLLRMRFKNKAFVNHFVSCFKELLNKDDGTFDTVLRHVICNELSQVRNMNNLQLISIIFQQNAHRATVVLARYFFSMVINREDLLRALRSLFREIVRQLRYEHIVFSVFVDTLLDESRVLTDKPELYNLDDEIKKRVPIMIVDLVTMTILLSVNPNVREAFSTSKPDRREIIRNFQLQIANIQRRTVEWLRDTMIRRFPFDNNIRKTFISCLNKVLFFENIEQYCKIDNWPPENDRNFVFRVTSEVPLLEATLCTILKMGQIKEYPLSPNETCEISYGLIQRAASIYIDPDLNYQVLLIDDCETIISSLFESCAYSSPENSVFPPNYGPPKMAVIDLYWKVWFQVFILAAHLPAKFGKFAWGNLPTFRVLIEMAITNNYHYPPKNNDDLLNKELQISQIEKIKILEFENYLAGNQEINETNSYLLSTLISLEPFRHCRRPTLAFLEDLKVKCQKFRLYQLLYQSRDPDYLLTIIEQQQNYVGAQTTGTPMTWLVELVESNEGNFGMLPIQCLCEFLFGQISEELISITASHETSKMEKIKKKDKRRKQIRLVAHFQNVIQQSNSEYLNEPLDYLIHRLSSSQSLSRTLAYKTLYLIVTTNPEEYLSTLDDNNLPALMVKESPNWLQEKLVKYLKNENHIQAVSRAMIEALQCETDPILICEYLNFIAHYVRLPEEKLAIHCSTLLINRKTIASHILNYASDPNLKTKFLGAIFKIYSLYMDGLLKGDIRPKPDDRDPRVFARFANNRVILISPIAVYGIISVLPYVTDAWSGFSEKLYKLFIGEASPQLFLDPDQKNPMALLPHWLVLKLLCSQSTELINLVLANVRYEDLINFLSYYGLSTNALQKILQTLDKLKATDSAIKNASFNRENLLITLQVYWMKGITHGYKFAKVHLNYKGDVKDEDNTDVEMSSTPTGKKREDKSSPEVQKVDTFKKDDIVKLFKEKDTKRIIYLSRQISTELDDKNVKTKKLTKLFLTEFNSNMEKIVNLIIKGHFNSLFNVMVILILKDPKHYGFNSDFQTIKKSLLSLEFANGNSIEDTSFWNCFDRFFNKESPKGKKTKQVKKKTYNLKTHDDLDKFLRSFTFSCSEEMQNQSWCEIFKDLAVEKFYNKDTELEDSNASLQSVIFSRNRPYFLSLLLHKCNFSTLNHCVDYLLNEENNQLNPSAILDFFTICINSPRLSICRDAETKKIDIQYIDILQLSNEQIRKLISYVIVENDVVKRIDLVRKSCCVTTSKVAFVVNLLKNYTDEGEEKAASELYTRLYLHIPNVDLSQNLHDDHIRLIQLESSFVDKITHNLITSFMFVEPNSAPISSQLFRYWELSLLKMASKHPLLVIRQLPMVPALLSGKVNLLNYDAFKSLNLLNIFHKFLNILKLLRPFLWNHHTRGVVEILDLYMDFFMAYYHLPRQKDANEEILPLLKKFIFLIDDWLKHDSDAANNWIKQQKPNLTELSLAYHREQNLIKSIISGLPSQNQALLALNCHNSLVKLRANQFNQELLMSTLQESVKQSTYTPEIAEHLLDEVRNMYTNPVTCELSLKLSLNALQSNPNLSKSIISTYLRCFKSETSTVSNLALNYMPEFVVLSQEYRYSMLRKAFELAINNNSNALSALNDSFKALKSQLGC